MSDKFAVHKTLGKGEFKGIDGVNAIIVFGQEERFFALKQFNNYFTHNISEINNAIKQLIINEENEIKLKLDQVKNITNWFGENNSNSKRTNSIYKSKSRYNYSDQNSTLSNKSTHCWKCKEPLSYTNPHCSNCKGIICPKCGACLCGHMWW